MIDLDFTQGFLHSLFLNLQKWSFKGSHESIDQLLKGISTPDIILHLLKNMFYFPLWVLKGMYRFKRNLSLLKDWTYFYHFSQGLNQLEDMMNCS